MTHIIEHNKEEKIKPNKKVNKRKTKRPTNKKFRSFHKFLETCKVSSKTKDYNYVSMEGGMYNITDTKTFNRLYLSEIKKTSKKSFNCGLVPSVNKRKSFYYHIDIDHLGELEFNKVLSDIIKIIEKNIKTPNIYHIVEKNKSKNNYHIRFTQLFVNKSIKQYLNSEINMAIRRKYNVIDDIVDNLKGACLRIPYFNKFVKERRDEDGNIIQKTGYVDNTYYEILDIKNIDIKLINEIDILKKGELCEMKHRINLGKCSKLKTDKTKKIVEKKEEIVDMVDYGFVDEDWIGYKELKEVLNLLDKTRFETYENWLKLVYLIFNIGLNNSYMNKLKTKIIVENMKLYYDLLDNICKDLPNYDIEENAKIFQKLIDNFRTTKQYITPKTLYFWLKQDKPEQFKQIYNKPVFKKDINFSFKNFRNIDKIKKCNNYYMKKIYFERFFKRISDLNSYIRCSVEVEKIKINNKKIISRNLKVIKIDINGYVGCLKYIDANGEKKDFLTTYKNDDNRSKYLGLVFKPTSPTEEEIDEDEEESYNEWQGFGFMEFKEDYDNATEHEKKEAKKSLEYIKKMINVVICDNNEKKIKHFTSWIAHIIQEPSTKNHISYILRSVNQGVGKNEFVNFIFDIIGQQYTYITSDIKRLTAKHSTASKKKLINVGDEIQLRDSYKEVEAIKSIITRDRAILEPKGIDEFDLKCFVRLLILTNNKKPIPIQDNDRRFVYLLLNESLKDDSEFIDNLTTAYKNPLVKYLFGLYLINYKIPYKNREEWRLERPNDINYFNCRNKNIQTKTLEYILNRNNKYDINNKDNKDKIIFSRMELYDIMKKVLDKENYHKKDKDIKPYPDFDGFINEFKTKIVKDKINKNGGKYNKYIRYGRGKKGMIFNTTKDNIHKFLEDKGYLIDNDKLNKYDEDIIEEVEDKEVNIIDSDSDSDY